MDALSLKRQILSAGAVSVGFAPLREVPPEVMEGYAAWLDGGNNGSMAYLADHLDIRRNPALLLDGGKDPRPGGTVISMAFPYYYGDPYREGKLKIARYALGDDYHEVLRARLRPVANLITAQTGQEARICVDTAPIFERHWAVEAGIGFIGRNRQLIIPGIGSHLFLAEIVTRAFLPPDHPSGGSCPEGCDRCLRACPGGALSADSLQGLDARHCHSYLTIEHRGELPPGFAPRKGRLYGCDLCQESCPLSRPAPGVPPGLHCLPEFLPREPLLSLTPADILALDPRGFSTLFRHSPVKRAKLPGLLRNVRQLMSHRGEAPGKPTATPTATPDTSGLTTTGLTQIASGHVNPERENIKET